jgi:hypothetical protein
MPRQHLLEPGDRPLLQRLGQQRVVGVGERALGQVPGDVPAEPLVIDQDAHQLGHRQSGVRVVHLDRRLLRQRREVGVEAAEAAHQVAQRAGDQEIFLQEAQALAHAGGIVGIEHAGQRFGGQRLGHRADELAMAELLEVEIVGRGRRPQPQRVDVVPAIAHDRPVERDADQGRGLARDGAQPAAAQLERAVEVDLDRLVESRHLPRIRALQPVVGLLALPAIGQRLPEDAVLVAQPVAHRRQLAGGQGIEEAGGEPAEPAIAEPGVGLLVEQPDPVEIVAPHRLLDHRIEQQVVDVVGQRPADQELHRQVVDPLRVLPLVGLLGVEPAMGEQVAHRPGEGLEPLAIARRGQSHDVVEDQVPLIERVMGAGELDRAEAILLEQLRHRLAAHRGHRRHRGRHASLAHRCLLGAIAERPG